MTATKVTGDRFKVSSLLAGRLKEHQVSVSFQQLVEETRRELAHHYLRHSTVELNEAAFLLGYERFELDLSCLSRMGRHLARGMAHTTSLCRATTVAAR